MITMYNRNWIYSLKQWKSQTYLPRRVSSGLTKLGPFLLANVVLFAYNVVDTILFGCKCPFGCQIRLKLSSLLPHSLKYFLFCPYIRCFRDIKFILTNEKKLCFIVTKINFLVNKQYATWKLKYLNILPYQILLSNRHLLPILVGDIHLITSDDLEISS